MKISDLTPRQQRNLWRKLVRAQDSCWNWTGAQRRGGYGQYSVQVAGRRTVNALVHRLTYEDRFGPVPQGLQLDHLCRNRLCANPAHLEAVTARENVLRSPIAPASMNARKDSCPQGHAYDEVNTRHKQSRGRVERICRACARNYMRRRRAAVVA